MKYYTIGQFSKFVGKSIQTLRLWDNEGKLKPHHKTDGGHRYYSEQQINQVLQVPLIKKNKKVVGYCRVLSNKQKDDLERQIENVKTYMIARGYQFEIITDIGSGINYNKKGLNQLIDIITNSEVERIVILYKDRLLRFGFEIIENLCNKYGTTIEIIDNTEKTEEQELVEDLVQIVTIFSCRLQGKRANKAKKMIKELLENDTIEENYTLRGTSKSGVKFISDNDLRKEITKLKKNEQYHWLNDVSNNVAKQAVKDACDAYKKFFKGLADKPRFKSRKKSKPSFYNDTSKLKVKEDEILIEKVGWVKLAETNRIPTNVKYTNPRISYDGKYWYISVGIEEVELPSENTDISIGIDLGLKDLAIVSNIDKPFKNINKTKEVKKLKKKLRKKQRQVSRKYEKNKIQIGKVGENRYIFTKTNNITKLEKEIKLIQRRLSNIRLNHIHQVTTEIVKTKPSKIVVEDLNVKGMMKNKHLSKAIQEQCFHKFISILEYKSKFNGIEFVKADRFYPSSKTCSCCGEVKKDLKLKDRVFICPSCNYKIDRDKNASINLSRYEKSA